MSSNFVSDYHDFCNPITSLGLGLITTDSLTQPSNCSKVIWSLWPGAITLLELTR